MRGKCRPQARHSGRQDTTYSRGGCERVPQGSRALPRVIPIPQPNPNPKITPTYLSNAIQFDGKYKFSIRSHDTHCELARKIPH